MAQRLIALQEGLSSFALGTLKLPGVATLVIYSNIVSNYSFSLMLCTKPKAKCKFLQPRRSELPHNFQKFRKLRPQIYIYIYICISL
jgi:hypothetical protein